LNEENKLTLEQLMKMAYGEEMDGRPKEGDSTVDQENMKSKPKFLLHPRQQANLARRLQEDGKAREARMKARE
jgi:hypothetical protein